MAVLTIHDLSLEIAYRDFEDGWVYYDIWLRWRGEPVINDAILKRRNEHWAKRGVGAIKACEHRECGILPLLRKVLETNESDYWEATDPDIVLAVYTNGGFPFLPSKWRMIYEKPEITAEREERDAKRAKCGPLPDDYVEILLFADVYNFAGAAAYYGNGVCFRLAPTRASLESFYKELRGEYVAFRAQHGVDAFNRENFGPDYPEPWF
jgi:hypothetical protein